MKKCISLVDAKCGTMVSEIESSALMCAHDLQTVEFSAVLAFVKS